MWKKKLLLAGVFLGGLIVVLIWIQGGFHSKTPGGRTEVSSKKPTAVKTIVVKPTPTKGEVTVSGTVVSRETASIEARSRGYVIDLMVDAGDTVKKDQVLLRIDNREVADRVVQARAALESAEAELKKASIDFKRFKSLYDKDSIAKSEFDAVTARFETAKAGRERAQAALKEAQTMLAYGEVKAPFDGVVSRRNVNKGDLVTPGRLLFTVFMPGTYELQAAAGEQYASYLKEGTAVLVRVPSINLDKKCLIREVVPQRNARTRTITVKAPLGDAKGLSPGLYGTMSFSTRASEMIVVPAPAVKIVGQLETVRVLEDGRIKVRHVKAGRRIGDKIEIVSGLSPGEKLVVK
jgi:RND family efflux transporter MFP subunit